MSKDIYQKYRQLKFVEEADIYTPKKKVIKGSIDGNQFSILVKERSLPEGTDLGFSDTPRLVAWENQFYLSWDRPVGVAFFYDIGVNEVNSGDLVSEIEGLEEREVTIEDNLAQFSSIDTEYKFTVTAVIYNERFPGTPVTRFSRNKTPANFTKDSQGSDSVSFSWDAITDAIYYNIYLEDKDGVKDNIVISSSQLSETINSISPDFYSAYVRSVSPGRIFESGKSTQVDLFISEVINDLSVSVDDVALEIDLSWSHVDTRDGYNVYLNKNNTSFKKLNDSLVTSNSYSLPAENGSFEFYVAPVKSSIEGVESNHVTKNVEVPILVITPEVTLVRDLVFDNSPVEVSETAEESVSTTVFNNEAVKSKITNSETTESVTTTVQSQ